MTVRSDKYDDYKAAMLAAGIPEVEIDDEIADMKAIDAKIEAGACPRCGAEITRTLDPRQAGATAIAGQWFNYRCYKCKWFGDRCEPVGEN